MSSVASAISFTATGGASSISGVTADATGTVGTQVDISIADGVTNQALALAIDISEVESIFLYTDGTLTVKTNSSSVPDQTLTFSANKPLAWVRGMPNTLPITVDVTTLYLTNASGAAVALRGFINQSL